MKIIDQEKMERIKALLKTHPRGLSITNLASITGLNRNLIAKYLDMLVISGQVEIQQYGPAKVYFLSQRIPVSAMIEISSDLVMVLDQDRKIVHVNKPFTQFLAIKRENLLGKTIGEVGHPFLASIPLPGPAAPLDTGDGVAGEVSFSGATGERFFRIKRAPAVFEDGAVGLTLIIEDITEQRKYQENLRLSEARYRGIVQDQTEFINRFLPDTTITFVNQVLCEYLHCRPEDLLGKRAIDLLPEEEREKLAKGLGSLTRENPTGVLEHQMLDGRGQLRWIHWTNRAFFDERGVLREFQGIGRDITDQRETAERISRYILQLEFISRKAVEFVHSAPGDDIFLTIARGVKSLCPEAGVCVLSSEGVGAMRVAAVPDDEMRNRIRAILGRDLVGARLSPSGEIMGKIRDGALHRVPGDLYLHCIPAPSPEEQVRLKDLFGNVDNYIMGLTHGDNVFGGVFLMFREGVLLQHEHLLVTYLNQASVAVQRQIYQEELRRSREEYRRIVENADEGIWVLDKDYRTTFVNRRLAEMLGYAPEELMGTQIEAFMLPEDIPAHHQRIAERRTGVSGRFEQRFRKKDGSLIWIMANATPLFESGEFAGAFAMVTDITTEKHAGEALLESEERYRDLTEASFDLIFTIDREDRIAYANRRCLEFLGREYEGVVGKPRASLFTPGISKKMRENLTKVFSTGEPLLDAENPVVLGDREYWLDTNLIPLKNDEGSVNLVMGISRDVTLRKKTEDALRESEEKYRTLIESTSDFIWEMDAQGKYTYCSPQMEILWGLKPEQMLGKTPFDMMPPEDRARAAEIFISTTQFPRSFSGLESAAQVAPGRVVYVETSGVPFLDRDGKLLGFRGITRDITERKRAEQALRESEGKYRALVEQAHDMIVVVQDGIVQFCNKRVAEMWGGNAREIVGQPYERFIDPEELPRVRENYLKRMAGEDAPELYDTLLLRRDGSSVHVDLSAGTIVFEGRMADLIVLRDITEKREVQEQLKRTYELQQAILSASPVGIGLIKNHALIWANDAMYRIQGIEPGSMKGQHESTVFAEQGEYERVSREIYDSIEKRGFGEVETFLKRKDGSTADIHLRAAPIRPGSPDVIVIASDITARKKAEEDLRRTEAFQEALLAASPVGIGVTANRVLTWANDAMTRIHGYQRREIEGQPARMLYEDDQEYARVTGEIATAMESRRFREMETVWVRKDGSKVDVLLSVGPVTPGSQETLAIAQDITEWKRAEKELRGTQAMQEAILKASPVGIGLVKPGRVLGWENDAMCRILGYGHGDLDGQPARILFAGEEEYERASGVLDRQLERDGFGEVDTVWKRKDGSRIDIHLRLAPVQPGSPDFIGVATDITARKQAENALRESEETFRTMVTINPLPLSLINAKGKYLYVNPAFTSLFGYTLEDIPDGKAWFTLAYPDEETRKEAIESWKSDAGEYPAGEVRPRTFRVRCRDGNDRDILFLPASTPTGLQVVVYEDLTGTKIQARLRESEDMYRHLVDDLNIGIYRSSGDPEGRFIWGNTGLVAILGYEDLADLQGVVVRDIFQKPGGRKVLLRELQEKKFVKNRLLSLRKKDGTPVKVSVTALAEFDEKGRLQFITGLVQEVKETKAG